MAGGCCSGCPSEAKRNDRLWRRVLWVALAVNAVMFGVEITAGVAAGSASLKADALDFLGDAANYAISLGVAGMALVWRATAAFLKGMTLFALALWVSGTTVWMALTGTLPSAETMGVVGVAALIANIGVAAMLYRYRGGDALGVDLLAQRRDRKRRRCGGRRRRVRHRNGMAGPDRRGGPCRPGRQRRLADHAPGARRAAGNGQQRRPE